MNRYENGKIYKITDLGYTKCYIGSTCESLSQRMARHRAKYVRVLNGVKMDTSSTLLFNEFGSENCKIELIENYPCQNVEELRKREGFFISTIDCVNRCIAGRTQREWIEQNSERVKKIKTKYYENNKDVCKERARKHREDNPEHSRRVKQEYREKNHEILKQKQHERYERNKEDRLEQVECPLCGSTVHKCGMRRHQKTKKCQSFKQ